MACVCVCVSAAAAAVAARRSHQSSSSSCAPSPPAPPVTHPPQEDFGPQLTFLGLPTSDPSDPAGQDWFVELLAQPVQPPNLHAAFRETRAARVPA